MNIRFRVPLLGAVLLYGVALIVAFTLGDTPAHIALAVASVVAAIASAVAGVRLVNKFPDDYADPKRATSAKWTGYVIGAGFVLAAVWHIVMAIKPPESSWMLFVPELVLGLAIVVIGLVRNS